MKVMAITSTKGGTGKSTSSISLAIAISKLLKRKKPNWVTLIDGDRRVRTTELKMCPISEEGPTLEDVLEGDASWDEAVYQCPLKRDGELLYPNLAIMPAGSSFMPTSSDPDAIAETVDRFDEVVDGLRKRNAFVLIDTAAGFDLEHFVLLAAADGILTTVNPNDDSIDSTVGMLRETREVLPYLQLVGCVLNRVPQRVKVTPWKQKAGREIGTVLGVVPEDPKLDDAFRSNLPVHIAHPDAPSAKAFDQIAKRVLGVAVPESKTQISAGLEKAVDFLARDEIRRREKEEN